MDVDLVKSSLKVFSVTLAFSLILVLFGIYRQHIIFSLISGMTGIEGTKQLYFYSFVFTCIQYLISPVFLFVVAYFVGKRVELKAELSSIIIFLFLGSLVGPIVLLGYSLLYSAAYQLSTLAYYGQAFLGIAIQGLQLFFISFSAMAIAFLRRIF